MLNLIESIIEVYFNYIKIVENLDFNIDSLNLKLEPNKSRCLARIWDFERMNPNLRCNNKASFNGLCHQHFFKRPLKHKLVSEDPPELEILEKYRKVNPNVDNEIEIFNDKPIYLFRKKKTIGNTNKKVKLKIVKDKTTNLQEMNNTSINYKHVSTNLVSIVNEKHIKPDIETIYEILIKDFQLQTINDGKKQHLKSLIENNLIDIEIEYNKYEVEKQKKMEKKKKLIVKKSNSSKKIEDDKSSITKSSKITNSETNYYSDEDSDDIDSVGLKELMAEYTELIKNINLQIPKNFTDSYQSIRIVDFDSCNDINCYLFEEKEKTYLLNSQGMIIGERRIWVDNNLPDEFKNNEDQILHPETCLPISEYEIYDCSVMFHNIKARVYREFQWNDMFNELQLTNEIFI